MATATLKRRKPKKRVKVLQDYDAAADAKNRISLRGAKTKYFHVKPLSNGGYLLEPRVLVAPRTVPGEAGRDQKPRASGTKRRGSSGTVANGAPKKKRPPAPKGLAPDGLPWVIHDPSLLPKLPPGESFYDKALPILKKAWARNRRLPRDLSTNPKHMEGFGE